jgi:AcrR family transcriptional regulator
MPKPSKRDQLVEATKELLWEAGYEAMSPRDIQARSAAKPGSLYFRGCTINLPWPTALPLIL